MKKIKQFLRKNKAKQSALMLLFLFSVALFSGCVKEEKPAESSSNPLIGWPVVVNGVEINEPPTRIASLSPALTEMLFEFGMGSRMVAVSDYCNYPESAVDLPRVGTAWNVNLQAIEQYAPEYVLVQSTMPAETVSAIEALGAKVVVILPGAGMDSVLNLYQQLFYFGYGIKEGQEKADMFLDEFDRALNDLKTKIPEKGYKAAYLVGAPESAATIDTFENSILAELKLTNVTGEAVAWNFPDKSLVAADPDVLIVSTDTDVEAFKADEAHKGMKAVTNNQIYVADQIVFERQSPRMLEEIEILARAIYGSEYGVSAEPLPSSEENVA